MCNPVPAPVRQAVPVMSTWDDDSGLEDFDVDQLVSQHRSKPTPLSSSSCEHSDGIRGSQSVTRPAAAAASALVRSAQAQTQPNAAPYPNLPPQHSMAAASATQHSTAAGLSGQQQNMGAAVSAQHSTAAGKSTQQQLPTVLAPVSSAIPAPKYPAERLGLQGVNERLVDLSNLIIDAQCEPQQMAVLHAERKHLLVVQQRLKGAAAMQINQVSTQANSMAAPSMQPTFAADTAVSSWPQQSAPGMHASGNQQLPAVSRQQQSSAAFGQQGGWDQGAVSASLPGNPWEGEDQGRHSSMQQAGSSSFAYDAPDSGFRSDCRHQLHLRMYSSTLMAGMVVQVNMHAKGHMTMSSPLCTGCCAIEPAFTG